MALMNKSTFVCIDCETTGLDPIKDQIIEVAVVKFNLETILEEFESLIDPGCPIPETSIAIHHITPEMVFGKPKIGDLLPVLLELIGKHTIVGHGVSFDIELLAVAADRLGLAHNLRYNLFFDTLRMARIYGESPTNSLEKLRQHFNIEAEGAHRAMNDVIVNVEVFKYLARHYKTTTQLSETLSRPIQMKTMPLGKHKGRALKEIPIEYLKWAAHKDFDGDLLFTIRTELKRRKGGNLFSQSGNPFGNL